MKRTIATVAAIAVAVAFAVAGCSGDAYKDADQVGTNDSGAEIGTMPNDFSNFATKCDNGNRVYTINNRAGAFGAIALVPADPTCK